PDSGDIPDREEAPGRSTSSRTGRSRACAVAALSEPCAQRARPEPSRLANRDVSQLSPENLVPKVSLRDSPAVVKRGHVGAHPVWEFSNLDLTFWSWPCHMPVGESR